MTHIGKHGKKGKCCGRLIPDWRDARPTPDSGGEPDVLGCCICNPFRICQDLPPEVYYRGQIYDRISFCRDILNGHREEGTEPMAKEMDCFEYLSEGNQCSMENCGWWPVGWEFGIPDDFEVPNGWILSCKRLDNCNEEYLEVDCKKCEVFE